MPMKIPGGREIGTPMTQTLGGKVARVNRILEIFLI